MIITLLISGGKTTILGSIPFQFHSAMYPKPYRLAGRIDYNYNLNDTSFHTEFVIDGKRITIEQFVEMLQVFEGFNFKFSIHDPSDELPE